MRFTALLRTTPVMRKASEATNETPGRVPTAGVSLSPAGAAGASPVLERPIGHGRRMVWLSSRPAMSHAWTRTLEDTYRQGGASRITAECNIHLHGVVHRN